MSREAKSIKNRKDRERKARKEAKLRHTGIETRSSKKWDFEICFPSRFDESITHAILRPRERDREDVVVRPSGERKERGEGGREHRHQTRHRPRPVGGAQQPQQGGFEGSPQPGRSCVLRFQTESSQQRWQAKVTRAAMALKITRKTHGDAHPWDPT